MSARAKSGLWVKIDGYGKEVDVRGGGCERGIEEKVTMLPSLLMITRKILSRLVPRSNDGPAGMTDYCSLSSRFELGRGGADV
jgi:hypothetical protein